VSGLSPVGHSLQLVSGIPVRNAGSAQRSGRISEPCCHADPLEGEYCGSGGGRDRSREEESPAERCALSSSRLGGLAS